MKKFYYYSFILLISIGLINFMSCASSKPPQESEASQQQEDDYAEIEKLLGINREEMESTKKADEEKSENGDLLKLLQAGEGKGKKGAESPKGDQRIIGLQKQVENLKKQLREKNILIADLKAQLMMKEEALKRSGAGQSSMENLGATGTSGISESEFQRIYNEALDLFNNRQYQKALRQFESLLATNAHHDLSDNAQYWIGECHYALGDYRAAILAFEKVFTFTQSNKNDYAQYKLGLCYFKLGDRKRARVEFQSLLDNYPDSPLVQKAQQYLTQL